MNIIAAHRQGLIEQLDEEVAALTGRASDHVQRAIVLHHLYHHSRGSHFWALAEARRGLRLAAGLDALRRRLDRWGWLTGKRDQAKMAIELLADAIGQIARQRTLFAYRAYRLSSTPALINEAAAASPDAELLDLLGQCHAARRAGETLPASVQLNLAKASERSAAQDHAALDLAWAAINATGLRRAGRRLLGESALERLAAKDQRRGAARVEQELLSDPALPAAFRANPAQHFYALQRLLHERRRQGWRRACDQVSDAFELAA